MSVVSRLHLIVESNLRLHMRVKSKLRLHMNERIGFT